VQTTLKSLIRFSGVGLHSGKPVRMTIHPASASYGIWFRRTDVLDQDSMIPARYHAAVQSPLCTRLVNGDGVEVSTVEHVMAALAGCGVHNALIEIDGPEVPILDGSAAIFVRAIMTRGLRRLDAPVHAIEVLRQVSVRQGESTACLSPAQTTEMDFSIDFTDAAIGHQEKRLVLANGTFVRELANSRTFCRQADVEAMRENGLALGGTYENAVVVDGAQVLSPGGLRHADEAVRHKMLDALGDLALAGAPLLGRYTGVRAGHTLTNKLLHALFADPLAYRVVTCSQAQLDRLPGAGLHMSDLASV
jgi:UDP-3-O-[3-hydroxymyristoyl] N-acetylglucosamine deacetylase